MSRADEILAESDARIDKLCSDFKVQAKKDRHTLIKKVALAAAIGTLGAYFVVAALFQAVGILIARYSK